MTEPKRNLARASAALDRLRENRVREPRDPALSDELSRQQRAMSRTASAVGGLCESWESVAPAELRGRAGPTGLSGGVLTIAADDQAARYMVDRWLRGGGEALLVAKAGTAVRRVKIVVKA